MGDFKHIIEPDRRPEPETYTAGPRARATIIQTSKCKRLHFVGGSRLAVAVVSLVAVGYGAGHAYGVDAGIRAVGLALAASTWSMR